jgi:hypothetical protein
MLFLKKINSKMPLLASSGTTVPSFVYCTDVDSESYIDLEDLEDDSVHDDDEADYDKTENCENRHHLPGNILHHIMTRPIVDDDREWFKASATTTTTTVEQHTSDEVMERSTVDHNDDGCATVSIDNSMTETGDESSGRRSDAGPVSRRILITRFWR